MALAAVCGFDCGGVVLGDDAGTETGRADAALDGHTLDGTESVVSPPDGTPRADGDAALGQGCPPAGHVFEQPSDPCDWTGVCSISIALCGPVEQFLATCPDGHIGIETGSPCFDAGPVPDADFCPVASDVRPGHACSDAGACLGVISCGPVKGDANGMCTCMNSAWSCDTSSCAGDGCYVGATCTARAGCGWEGTGPCGSNVNLACGPGGVFELDHLDCLNLVFADCRVGPLDAGPDGGAPCLESCTCEIASVICNCVDGGA